MAHLAVWLWARSSFFISRKYWPIEIGEIMNRKRGPDTRAADRARRARKSLRDDVACLRASIRVSNEAGELPQTQTDTDDNDFNFTDKALATARRTVRDAELWARQNASAYDFMVRRCRDEVAAGRRFSMAAILHETRGIDFTDTSGCPTRIDNSICPALSRLIAADVPGMAELTERRRTAIDRVMREEAGYVNA